MFNKVGSTKLENLIKSRNGMKKDIHRARFMTIEEPKHTTV